MGAMALFCHLEIGVRQLLLWHYFYLSDFTYPSQRLYSFIKETNPQLTWTRFTSISTQKLLQSSPIVSLTPHPIPSTRRASQIKFHPLGCVPYLQPIPAELSLEKRGSLMLAPATSTVQSAEPAHSQNTKM